MSHTHTFDGNTTVVSSEVLDHLGLVAATIDKLDLINKIDTLIPVSRAKGAKLTHGQMSNSNDS